MSITLDWKGTQITYFPERKSQIIEIPYRKNSRIGEEIVIDKILKKDDKFFGQPYLPIRLIAKVVNPSVVNEKIRGMKYKGKKRYKKTWGHLKKCTEIEIIRIEE